MAGRVAREKKELNNEEEEAGAAREVTAQCVEEVDEGEEKSRGGCVIMGFLWSGTDMGEQRVLLEQGGWEKERRHIPDQKQQTMQRWMLDEMQKLLLGLLLNAKTMRNASRKRKMLDEAQVGCFRAFFWSGSESGG